MALAVAWAAVPLHPRFNPGAGCSPLPRRGEGIVAPVRPRASPAVASLPRPSVGRLSFAKWAASP